MVKVNVIFMGELRRWAGSREVGVTLPEGSTVLELAQKLSDVCGKALSERVITKEGFSTDVAVFLNGEDIRQLADGRTILAEGEMELMMLSQYEGGA